MRRGLGPCEPRSRFRRRRCGCGREAWCPRGWRPLGSCRGAWRSRRSAPADGVVGTAARGRGRKGRRGACRLALRHRPLERDEGLLRRSTSFGRVIRDRRHGGRGAVDARRGARGSCRRPGLRSRRVEIRLLFSRDAAVAPPSMRFLRSSFSLRGDRRRRNLRRIMGRGDRAGRRRRRSGA